MSVDVTPGEPADARRIAAVLANTDMRRTYAEVVLGHETEKVAIGMNPARRKRVLSALIRSGLISESSGGFTADDSVFRQLLEQHPKPEVATGVDRFLRAGRIDRYPANATDRRALLAWIVDETVQRGETLDEKQLTERLSRYSDDHAELRRYLVDFALLERTASGSSYSRPST